VGRIWVLHGILLVDSERVNTHCVKRYNKCTRYLQPVCEQGLLSLTIAQADAGGVSQLGLVRVCRAVRIRSYMLIKADVIHSLFDAGHCCAGTVPSGF